MDYLLGHPDAVLVDDVRSAGVAAECAVARAIAAADGVDPVPGVGASDCGCASHLAFSCGAAAVDRAVEAAHGRSRG